MAGVGAAAPSPLLAASMVAACAAHARPSCPSSTPVEGTRAVQSLECLRAGLADFPARSAPESRVPHTHRRSSVPVTASTRRSRSVSADRCRRSSSLPELRVRPSRALSTTPCAAGPVSLYAATVALTSTSPLRAMRSAVSAAVQAGSFPSPIGPATALAAAFMPTARCTRGRTSPVTGAPPCEKKAVSASGGGWCVAKKSSSHPRPASALRPAPASTALLALLMACRRRSSPAGKLCSAGCHSAALILTPRPAAVSSSDSSAWSEPVSGLRTMRLSFICPLCCDS